MKYLLDTCFLSEFVKKNPPRTVVDWGATQNEDDLHVSVLTLGEIQKGVSSLPVSRRRAELQRWLDYDLQERFHDRTLAVTAQVARRWGKIQGEARLRGRSLPVVDSLLAATALEHDLTLVTNNVDDMRDTGVRLCNPWCPQH